jgi:hypothetical protein
VQVHKPNMEHIKTEANRVREQGSGFGDQDLNFYDWKNGENNLRILPPWSAKGLVFKKVLSHFEIPPERSIVKCMDTWPDKFDLCYTCEAIDKVIAQLPELDLGRQKNSTHFYANVIDRDEEEKGVQVCRFTSGVYNWLVLQMDNPKIGDITDYEQGFDIIITKSEKPRKKGKGTQTNYSCSFVPRPCPLHETDEAMAQWLQSLFDLDRVFGPPDDEGLAEMKGAASRMVNYYFKKFREGYSVTSDDADEPSPRREAARRDEPKSEAVSPDAVIDTPPPQSQQPAKTLEDIDPKGVPSCFAGLKDPEKHSDGTVGFNEMLEKCLLCAHELRCMDAKASKGL